MTRRARSGNTQKHQKMPEDPTPWSEFSKQITSRNVPEKKLLHSDGLQGISYDKTRSSLEKVMQNNNDRTCNFDSGIGEGKNKAKVELKLPVPSHEETQQTIVLYNKKNKVINGSKGKCFKNTKQEVRKEYFCKTKHSSPDIVDMSSSFDSQFVDNDFDVYKLNQMKEENITYTKKPPEESTKEKRTSKNNLDDMKLLFSKGKYKYDLKKNLTRTTGRVQKSCHQIGIPLLSSKVEHKLYNIKKRLRRDEVADEKFKKIIRQTGRKEQLHLRLNTSKICFNCRQAGHTLSECPSANNHEQGTGICFKCGSTEHVSSKCRLKISGFPFATCFVCREKGHIVRDCPQNKHGIYPKGGKCDICGNVNHLKKDCPTMKKAKAEDKIITAHIITEISGSIDAELVEEMGDEKQKVVKTKKKIIKFN